MNQDIKDKVLTEVIKNRFKTLYEMFPMLEDDIISKVSKIEKEPLLTI